MSQFVDEVCAMAEAMTRAARECPGKLPPQATVPGAALVVIEASVKAAPETRGAVVSELLDLAQRLIAEGRR